MTALAVYWYETGRLESWAAFPAIPDLAARGKADGVGQRYETMQRRAELTTFEGRITPISAFLLEAMERLQDVDVACLLADRFKANELPRCASARLAAIGLPFSGAWASKTAVRTCRRSKKR